MSLFAIADLHLPGGDDKPMNVFGDHWEGHFGRISRDWLDRVAPDDTVLIPGDISWAMQLRDALPDLEQIAALPGRKIILKGNHDYWWGTVKTVRAALPGGMEAIQHSAADLGDAVVCGTRGWSIPTKDTPLNEEDERICRREVIRLELALKEAAAIAAGRPIVVMMHYPPLLEGERDTVFTRIIGQYPVHTVVYGHLHGAGIRAGFNGTLDGVRYQLVSCDALGFSLAEIPLA